MAEGEDGEGEEAGMASRTMRVSRNEIAFLASMDFNLKSGSVEHLGSGEIFGEIGAMSGWPQSVTARVSKECKVIQVRVPALRLMKKKSRDLKERIDNRYRERSAPVSTEDNPPVRTLLRFVPDVNCGRGGTGVM